jgi:cytochrome c oxidase assembly factor CtaG
LDGFADVLLSAHMVQHLLLMSVVPPLLLLGWPVVPLLRGLPPWILRPVLGPLLRLAVLRRLGRWVTSPLVGWMAMNLTFLGWHVPAALAGPGANPFHVSPLSDQMLGAVIMWVVGSFVFLVPATWITFKLLTAF